MAEEGYPVDLVQSDDNLTVTSPFERPSSIFGQLLPTFVILIEFSVHNSVDLAVWRVERLLAVRAQVVDCETNVTQCCDSLSAEALSWPARVRDIPTRPSVLVHVLRASGPRCLIVSRLCSNFEVVELFVWLCGVPPVTLGSSNRGDSDTTAEIPHISDKSLPGIHL